MSSIAAREEYFDDVSNPLDSVEEILSANDWVFDRMGEDELVVQISGKMGEYSLSFLWEEEFSAMRFCCQYDLEISPKSTSAASKTMTDINTKLWLGHFAFREGTNTPCFRHTALFRGQTQTSGTEVLEDLVDIALSECERFYPAFHLLTRNTGTDASALLLAITPAVGES